MIDFKTILDERKSKWIAQAGAELLAQTEIKRWWPDVHNDSRFACVNYLNSKTSVLNEAEPEKLFVTNPLVDGEVLPGAWRLVYAGIEAGRSGVVQVLRKGFVDSLGVSGSVDWSEFFIRNEGVFNLNRQVPILRLNNVSPAAVHDLVNYLNQNSFTDMVYRDGTLTGTWLRVSVQSEVEEDGSYHIEVMMRNALPEMSYIVCGGRKTAFVNEEQRLYQYIPESYVTQLVNELVVLGDYTLVDADARKTSEQGIFDLFLTLRTHVVPPGGTDIIIGGSGGLFRTQLRMIRDVKDVDVEDTVNGLMQLSLIDNVRASGGREDGIWDIIYSKLIVPAPRSESKKSEDRRQAKIDSSEYEKVDAIQLVPTGYEVDETKEKGYKLSYTPIHCVEMVLQDYRKSNANMTRDVTISKVISYSANYPGAVIGHGEVTQLSNGLWQKISENVDCDWWPIP